MTANSPSRLSAAVLGRETGFPICSHSPSDKQSLISKPRAAEELEEAGEYQPLLSNWGFLPFHHSRCLVNAGGCWPGLLSTPAKARAGTGLKHWPVPSPGWPAKSSPRPLPPPPGLPQGSNPDRQQLQGFRRVAGPPRAWISRPGEWDNEHKAVPGPALPCWSQVARLATQRRRGFTNCCHRNLDLEEPGRSSEDEGWCPCQLAGHRAQEQRQGGAGMGRRREDRQQGGPSRSQGPFGRDTAPHSRTFRVPTVTPHWSPMSMDQVTLSYRAGHQDQGAQGPPGPQRPGHTYQE